MARRIHATAVVDARAELDDDVDVGPFAIVGAAVRVGSGTRIGAHCVVEGPTTIGRDNTLHPHAVIGGAPQDMKYRGEPTSLEIGDRNTVREFCTFNRGTVQDGGVTRVGDDNWIMAYVHLAHDVQLGSRTVLANAATLAGHVHVGDWALIGGLTGVHQFCHVGAHAMTGFQSHVSQDVPPFMLVAGNPLRVGGVNAEGLRRRGFAPARIDRIRRMHRLLYRSGMTLAQARTAIAALAAGPGATGGAAAADPASGAVAGGVPPVGSGRREAPAAPGQRRETAEVPVSAVPGAPTVPADDGGAADVAQMLAFLAAASRGIVR